MPMETFSDESTSTFLTQFADQKAHDGGEFFTPVSLVQMIVNVIEPQHGRVLDPACGSGGMFVQSAHFIERMHENPTEQAHLLRHGKEFYHHPPLQHEPRRTRP